MARSSRGADALGTPPSEGASEPMPSLDELVEFEVFDMVARGLVEGLATGIVPLALMATLLQILAAPPHLIAWTATVAGLLLVGLLLSWRYRRNPPQSDGTAAWRRIVWAFIAIDGLAWGSAGVLFVPGPWQSEMLVLTLLTSLSAVVLANIGASLPLYMTYVAGIALPTIVYRAWLGGPLNLGLSIGALMTVLVLAVFASRLSAATRRSLRIGHENRRLALALAERTREAEQASLDKSRFLSAASHDLRQPVHALGLLLDVLHGQQLDARQQATATRMSQVVDSLDSLFGGLLDISKLDSGGVEARRTRFALAPLLAALAGQFAAEASAKDLSLRLRCPDVWIDSDPLLLERMLRNLLANSVRYTHRGGILLACRRRGSAAWIEVWDTGIGIAPEQQAAVFDEFFQVANAGRDRDQGLGLGLAIVRRLALLLEHPLDVRSRPQRGSVFRIRVAIVPPRPHAAIPAAPADRDIVQPSPWQGRRVLVVDDDPLARDALVRWLAAWGCEVTACASANDVRSAIGAMTAEPDALITDWRLPDAEDGLVVTRLLRERFGAKLPVILITGDALDDARRLAAEHEVVLLHKPVRPAALRAALSALWRPGPPQDGAVGPAT